MGIARAGKTRLVALTVLASIIGVPAGAEGAPGGQPVIYPFDRGRQFWPDDGRRSWQQVNGAVQRWGLRVRVISAEPAHMPAKGE